jgi:glycosyltransferase involved in cell wall biosynthesis
MIKIQWVTPEPNHYHDYLFSSLANDPEIELKVHFVHSAAQYHPWKTQFRQGFPSRTCEHRFGIDWQLLRQAIADKESFFVIAGWHSPTTISIINTLIASRGRFAIYADTPNMNLKRPFLKKSLRGLWLKRIFRHANWVIGTGKPALAALQKMGCPPEKLAVLPFFVDLDVFRPNADPSEKGDNSRIAFVSSGRLVNSIKGYDLAIKAFELVKKRLGEVRYSYHIAGVGPDKHLLEQQAKKAGVAQNIQFLGWLEPGELPQFYRTSQVLLHPAHFDAFAVTVAEAMASGLAVIGSDQTGAVLDRIEHLHNGLIHMTNNAEDLAAKIIFALEHRDAVIRMGIEARRTAEQWPVRRGVETLKALAG